MKDYGEPTEDLDILCNEMEQCFMQDDWKGARLALGKLVDPQQAVIDKLPKYADTGEPFMPGVDECWVIDMMLYYESTCETAKPIRKRYVRKSKDEELYKSSFGDCEWEVISKSCIASVECKDFYSTRQAAEAAR